MINGDKIRNFWEARGRKFDRPVGQMANLEPDPQLQELKAKVELGVIMPRLALKPEMNILDLGAGYGQWAMRFAPCVNSVCAVEYARSMLECGEKEADRAGIKNIKFVHSSAEDYESEAKWDVVFISGLFMYLNDDQGVKVAGNAVSLLAPGGKLFLREPVSLLPERHIINDRYSEAVQANYSALYRLPHEFVDLFNPLQLVETGNFFEDGCPLNKWKETRLRYFLFQK